MTGPRVIPLAATDMRYVLAEGPQWNEAEQTISWVDIEGGALIIGELLDDGTPVVRETRSFDDRVTFAHPLGLGSYVIGLGRRLAISRPSGLGETSVPLVPAGRRLNDSVVDPAGRLIVGGMTLDGEHRGNSLLRIEHDGTVTVLDDDLRLSNGLAFSPDGDVLYSVDSLAGVIYVRDYHVDTGAVGARRVVTAFDGVEPDGIAVDDEGGIWVALWGGSALHRYDSEGNRTEIVPVEPQHVTSLEFAGPERRHMVVTTSMLLLDEGQRSESKQAGRVLTFVSTFGGRARTPWIRIPLERIATSPA